MRIAHLILAHKSPEQLSVLIDMIQTEGTVCYIQLDAKTDIRSFAGLIQKSNVHFIKNRVNCVWGNYSLVQATINGMREILENDTFDYINFISGQDLPLTKAEDFKKHLTINCGQEFINAPVYNPSDPWWIKNECRFFEYNFHNWKIPGKYRLQFMFNRIVPKRKFPEGIQIAGNSQWFCITAALAKYMINHLDNHPEIVRYFKYVWGADEYIFATIARHSPFQEKIGSYLHYIDWTDSTDAHPKTLGKEDLDKAIASGKFFARKFDLTSDPDIPELIANRLGPENII